MEALENFINEKEIDHEKLKDLLNDTYFLNLNVSDLADIGYFGFSYRKNQYLKYKIEKKDLEIFRDHAFAVSFRLDLDKPYYNLGDVLLDVDKIIEMINNGEMPATDEYRKFFPKRGLKTKGCQ